MTYLRVQIKFAWLCGSKISNVKLWA